MSEPQYAYVKGQGWVVKPEIVVKTSDGTLVRIEVRKPVRGEYFYLGYAEEHMQRNIDHVTKVFKMVYAPIWEKRHWSESDETRENHVVLVPV